MEQQDNLGEVLFVNETTMTKGYLREFLRRVDRLRIPSMLLMVFMSFQSLYNIFQTVHLYQSYQVSPAWYDIGTDCISCGLFFLFFLFFWQRARIDAWLQFRRLKTYSPTTMLTNRYLFGDQILVSSNDGSSQVKYALISKILPTSFGCVLVMAKSTGLFIDRKGFTQGTYEDFCRFLQEKCVNLNKKARQITLPQADQPQQPLPEVREDTAPAAFVNKTTPTRAMYVSYYRKAIRFRIPLAVIYSLLSLYVLRILVDISLLATDSPASVKWWSIPLLVICTALIIAATIYFWRLPWYRVHRIERTNRLYLGETSHTIRYSFGEQILVQTSSSHYTRDYREISKIIDTDFGCAIVMAKMSALLVYSGGFTQGSYNDFRCFLAEKCPHLDKKHKS